MKGALALPSSPSSVPPANSKAAQCTLAFPAHLYRQKAPSTRSSMPTAEQEGLLQQGVIIGLRQQDGSARTGAGFEHDDDLMLASAAR